MPTVTVENLAKMIGSESEALLSQMKEAGLSHKDVSDEVTDQDKKTLLEFLKNQQTKSTKTISLNAPPYPLLTTWALMLFFFK